MGISLFRVAEGMEIQKDDLSATAAILVGTGLPGGDSGQEDAAAIGSTYQRTDVDANELQFYVKVAFGGNSSADWKAQASKDYVDAAIAGLKWREPAVVLDQTAYADSTAFPVTGTIDGVVLADQARVLFSDTVAAGEQNVWIWDLGTTSWTEDTHDEEDGDALLILEGTYADQHWTYNGTDWVQIGNSGDSEEIGYNRDFMGKTGPGAEMPTYTSNNNVTTGDSLETAIDNLDTAVGNRTFTEQNNITDGDSNAASINGLDIAVGDRTYTGDNVVVDGESVTASIDKLDIAIGALEEQNEETTGTDVDPTGGVVLDTIPMADATEIKWMIQVRSNTVPGNRRATELHAMNDAATLVDHTEYAILKLGSAIAGFDLDVDINGTDMRLLLTANSNVDYVVKRISYSAF